MVKVGLEMRLFKTGLYYIYSSVNDCISAMLNYVYWCIQVIDCSNIMMKNNISYTNINKIIF